MSCTADHRHRHRRRRACWRAIALRHRRPPRRRAPRRRLLSRETRRRDRSTVPGGGRGPGHRPRDRAGRRWPNAADRPRAGPVGGARRPGRRPTPSRSAFTRRQFFNRCSVTLMGVGLVGLRRGLHRLPVAEARRRVRLQDQRRQGRRPQLARSTGPRTPSTSPRPGPGWSEYPTDALPKAEKVYSGAVLTGMEAGIVALYQKCLAPRLPCAVLRDVAVVRVPVPRLAVQPGRREEGRPGAARHGPLRRPDRPAATWSSTPAPSSSARPSAPTPPARRPRARTASRRRGVTECSSPRVHATSPSLIAGRAHRRRGWCTSSGTCARRPGPRSAPRSSWRRTASRTSTTSSSKAAASRARS